MGLTIILTIIALAAGVAFYAFGGTMAFVAYALTAPVALFLLWMSRDVQSWEDKWAPSRPVVERPRAARAVPAESRA